MNHIPLRRLTTIHIGLATFSVPAHRKHEITHLLMQHMRPIFSSMVVDTTLAVGAVLKTFPSLQASTYNLTSEPHHTTTGVAFYTRY